MAVTISVIIPAHNEERYIGRCLESIRAAQRQIESPVEIVVVLNRCTDRTGEIARQYDATVVSEDSRNLAKIRNAGVRASSGTVVTTIDADSRMSANMLREVCRRLATGRYVGGGVRIVPERMSLGIFFSAITFTPKFILKGIWTGMFWMLRQTFEAIGGFNETLFSAEDIDFARRLKAFGAATNRRYGLIMRAHIVTSCRKFDYFGDWHFFRNRKLFKRILSGHDQEAADHFYYDVRKNVEVE